MFIKICGVESIRFRSYHSDKSWQTRVAKLICTSYVPVDSELWSCLWSMELMLQSSSWSCIGLVVIKCWTLFSSTKPAWMCRSSSEDARNAWCDGGLLVIVVVIKCDEDRRRINWLSMVSNNLRVHIWHRPTNLRACAKHPVGCTDVHNIISDAQHLQQLLKPDHEDHWPVDYSTEHHISTWRDPWIDSTILSSWQNKASLVKRSRQFLSRIEIMVCSRSEAFVPISTTHFTEFQRICIHDMSINEQPVSKSRTRTLGRAHRYGSTGLWVFKSRHI